MIRGVTTYLVMIITLSAFTMAQGPGDIDGSWQATMGGPQDGITLHFNFKTQGDSLTGSFKGPQGSRPITNGSIDGDHFSFDVVMGTQTIHHRCTVVNDSTISVTIPSLQGDTLQLTLTPAANQTGNSNMNRAD